MKNYPDEARAIAERLRMWATDRTASPTILGSIAVDLTALCMEIREESKVRGSD